MSFIHTPKEDGGWKQWFLREVRMIPTMLINLIAFVAIGVIVFLGR